MFFDAGTESEELAHTVVQHCLSAEFEAALFEPTAANAVKVTALCPYAHMQGNAPVLAALHCSK